jgi:hypothetical protein
VLDRLGEQGRLDWSRACVDTMSVRAKRRSYTRQAADAWSCSSSWWSTAKTSRAT